MKEEERIELINKTTSLKERHEVIKIELIKILNARRILEEQYHVVEQKMYIIENEYIDIMKKLTN